jgi:DNA-binding LacI/PurR family transcriptional regulator/DNA-binding transcriptional regulator YhcF (GntR family)
MTKTKSPPLYIRIYHDLRLSILEGQHALQSVLPSENDLCRQYKTSRRTVRNSLQRLAKDGLVANRPGKGWQVVSAEVSPRLTDKPAAILMGEYGGAAVQANEVRRLLQDLGIESQLYVHDGASEASPRDYCDPAAFCGVFALFCSSMGAWDMTPMAIGQTPHVFLRRHESGPFGAVDVDNMAAAEMLVAHLTQQGREHILFAYPEHLDRKHPSFRMRRLGYEQAVAKRGFTPLLCPLMTNSWGRPEDWARLQASLQDTTPQPSAVLCSSSSVGRNLLPLLRFQSLRVPDDLAVACFDQKLSLTEDEPASGLAITCTLESCKTVAQEAVNTLVRFLKGETTTMGLTLIPPTLQIGETTKT